LLYWRFGSVVQNQKTAVLYLGINGSCHEWQLSLVTTDTDTQMPKLCQFMSVCLFFKFTSLSVSFGLFWTSQREGSGYRGTRAMPYSIRRSFLVLLHVQCIALIYDTSVLKFRPNDMVRRGIELTIPGQFMTPPTLKS